jgi:type II secretory ATPase GspE/PulE/Tfp pilus assembly ATPase PilB-like protein/ActR/RegA family two-component response regulator
MERRMVGDLLVKAGVLDAAGLARVLEVRARDGGGFGRIAAALGLATEDAVARALAGAMGLDYLELGEDSVPAATAALLPAEFCRKRLVIPVHAEGKAMRLAMADPLDQATLQDAQFRTGRWVTAVVATEIRVLAALKRAFHGTPQGPVEFDLMADIRPEGEAETEPGVDLEIVDPAQLAKDVRLPPIVRLVNLILTDAAKAGASDLHVEPQEDGLLVRQRLDGMLVDVLRVPRHLMASVVSRLKIVAGMDIAERRKPQDGRGRLRLDNRRIDLRVSSLPTSFGEKIVVRLLESSSPRVELERMEMAPDILRGFGELLERPQGMVLVTGPTGSGKSSTLYAALNRVKSRAKNLITVEDPIEYQMPGVSQVQINTRAGVTFAAGLRSILRQDPDVVLVGEIRDQETAGIAVEAAQTGHLLLTTLHTNDAPSSITRMLDLGVEPFMLASSIIGVLAQRLVRRICPDCSAARVPDPEVVARLGGPDLLPGGGAWRAAAGCEACRQTGYRGRLAIHEFLSVDDAIRDLISRRAPDHEIREAARRDGLKTLLEDGLAKAARGVTTLEEVLRVAPHDEPRSASAAAGAAGGHSVAGRGAGTGARVPAGPDGGAAAPAAARGDGARVLVVEDSPTVVTVVKYFLELQGFEVLVAEDGAAGLAVARRHHPDVIVSDVQMPGMDGVALTAALRADAGTRDAGIILLTSETSLESEERGLSAGADDYIAKPVEPRRLAARVAAVLARAAARRRGAA